MNRRDILNILNTTILEEKDTVAVTEDNFLHESYLDSFGYAVFWITLNAELCSKLNTKTNILEKSYVDNLDMRKYEVSDLLDYIEKRIETIKKEGDIC